MRSFIALALIVVVLSGSPAMAQDSAPMDSLAAWYHQQYPFISMTDTIFTFESEFRTPNGYHRPDSATLTPFQNWMSHFPLWHQYKAVGIWSGGKAFVKTEISRAVHIPWRGPAYTDKGFPLRILAEFMLIDGREFDLTLVPRIGGDTLTYEKFLENKVAIDGRGAVKLVPATKRDTSMFEFYRFLSAAMTHQSYRSLAANGDSLAASEAAPGDLLIGHDESGRKGRAYLIMNMLVNDNGDKVYAVATGCEEACDYHIPLVTLDRDLPWLTVDQLEALVSDRAHWGFFRLHQGPRRES